MAGGRYYVCKTCGPASWIYASKVQKFAKCSWCGKPWPADVPQAPWREPSRPRPRTRQPKPAKLASCLQKVWSTLPADVRLQFEQAGFKVPAPKQEDVDLLSLLQRNREDLPQEVLDALPAAPVPNPVQEGKAAGVEWRNSVGKLRDLGQRKLKLQEDIDLAKANLRAMLTKMQDLQTSIQEAQTEVNKATQEYETKVLTQCNEEANHGVESVLQALGIQEEALTEAQKRSLEALKKENADEAKRRKTQQQEQFPPGLAPQLRSAAHVTEANKEAEDAKGPTSQPVKERSREVLRDLEISEPSASPDASPVPYFKCWYCGLPFVPTAVGARASICRADVSLVGASPQGSRLLPTLFDQPEQLAEGFAYPKVVGRPVCPPSSCPLTGPKFFHSAIFSEPADCKPHEPWDRKKPLLCRGPIMPFLERHGSHYDSAIQSTGSAELSVNPSNSTIPPIHSTGSAELSVKYSKSTIPPSPFEVFQGEPGSSPPSWGCMLNLSAYKALHPAWNQEPDLLHLGEGLEEQCQEGTLEHWVLFKSLEATEIQDHSLETWARIARASEDLVHSFSSGQPRTFKFVSANVTSWRPELRQWLVFHQFDVALIQEHHLSERAFHAETVALAKAGYHVHGQHSPVRKREIGGVMVCVKSHLQARHVHTFQDPETGCGFVAIAIRVTGFDLALLSLYLESGSTFEGRANTLVLSNMYAVIASLKCPWCVVGDWNLDACEVLATRLEDLTKGRLLGTGMPTAGTAAELDYALVHPRLASHLSLELAWDVPFKPHAALKCTLPLKSLQDLQPNLRSITDSFDPILDDQRNLQPPVVSPQRVTLLEIEACDPASLAFAEFSATAEASGLLGRTMGRGVNLPTIRQPAVSQPPNDYQWFGHEHAVWSQLAGRFKAGGPPNETLSLLSKLGPEHHQWADEARDTVSNHRDLAALRSHAEAQAKLAKTAQQGAQAESYQQWLFGALSAGMGPVYRALKSHEQTLARPFRDQSALARAYCRMEFWSRIWDASIVPPQPHLSAERLALRAEALQQAQDLSPLSWEQVKTACLATGNKKGGLDGWSYKALRNLPDFCYRQLAGLFRLAETDLTLPLQMLTVQVALLAKTPEKERPISLTSVLWRVYSKLRRPLLESWLKEYAAFAPFDSATPGHTSLDPALSRLIKAEDHKFRKVTFITLFVDLEGFYDGVDFSRLISQGKALSFPPLLLELSLQLYNGPRCLHGEGVSTVALWPQRGILQGCPYAPTVAKLTTHAPLQGISQHRGVSHADLWLDDISVDVSHADPEVAASLALSASRKLEALLSVEKLCINKTKTKFVVNSAKAAKALNSMRVEGDPQVADLVRDLGLDSAGAKRRRVTQALKRFKVGRARNQKLHQLGTGCKAHRLYATSILTAEIYGCQGQGLSPKRLKVVRASISRHVGRSKWGSVDVSLDCMSFRCQDPLLTVVLAQADALYKMFGPSTAQGWEILARTWKVAWTRQEAAVHGWKCVAGPVAAMVQYCIDLRINVSDPLRWVHSSGVLLLDVTNPGLFLSVRRFLTQVVALERASRFGAVLTAQGAQQGVDWSVHRKLLKVSKLSSPRWAFHAVWQGRTLHAGNGGFSHCACGAENTLHHVYYECPLAPAKLSPALRSFQRKHPDPCFWLRGMVPKAWTTPQVSASALETRVTGLFCHQPVDVTGLLIGTDASGGPNTHDPRLRAVGWSVVLCELRADCLIEHGTISGLLPPGSTVPQGESLAIIEALKATTGSFDLTGDCKPALKALAARALNKKHIPEWGPVWQERARAQPHWVRSHCTAEAFEAEFPGQLWRRELNAKADTLAGSRAAAACTPHFVRKVKELDLVTRELNCFLASRAEKLIKEKAQGFVPRSARDSLSQFDKPRSQAAAVSASTKVPPPNKKQRLKQLLDSPDPALGHDWKARETKAANNFSVGGASTRSIASAFQSASTFGAGPMPERVSAVPKLGLLSAAQVNPPAGPVASSAAATPRLPECQGEVTQSTGVQGAVGQSVSVGLRSQLGMPAAVPPAQGQLSMAPKQEGRHISTQLRREERGLSWKSAATIDRQRGRKKARKQKKRREQYEHAGRRTEEAWPPPPPPPGPRAEARHREDEELPYDLEEPSPSGLRAPSTAAASSSQGPAREEPSPLGLRAPPPTAAASSSQGLPLQRLPEAEEPPVDQDDSSNCLQSDSSETPQPAVALKDRPSDFGPLLHEDGLITFLCAAAPQVKHPVNHYQCLPESLEVYHDFVTGGRTKAARARRLGFGKSRTVYVDPGSSEHVLKLAPPQGHGPEPEAWRRLPHIVPCTLDAGIHLLTLSWKSCYDIIPTHVLRQSRLTPLSVWRPAPPDLDMVRYMMALTAEASRFYNLKDLGFFNFGVDARGFIMMWDTADWLPWEGQRAHWPNRQRASAFWSAVKRSVPDHFQELLQLVSNASPEEVLQRLRPLLTQHYKWYLLQQGVFLGD
ncbi:unnamed protein product [Symbiodinium sp. CCMP2592]|nr:unnamed protein product [Symbiodinium sp. CCMP2592]